MSGLFDDLKKRGKRFAGRLFKDIKNESKRLGIQGSMEFASALFNGHAFVPYGPGQYTQSPKEETEATGQKIVDTTVAEDVAPSPEKMSEPQRDVDGRGR